MKIAITNAFSINMLSDDYTVVRFERLSMEDATKLIQEAKIRDAEITGAIGHPDTARIVEDILGINGLCNRISVRLSDFDVILVAQYVGPRLPEGVTKLPENAKIDFYKVDEDELCSVLGKMKATDPS